MVIQRLALILSVFSTSFCTDHGLQTGVGDKVVSNGSGSGESNEGRTTSALVPGVEINRPAGHLNLDQRDSSSGLLESVSPSSPLVTTTGQGVCDSKVPSCGPSLIVHLPTDPLFQEGSGGPTEPIEVHGILEFFQTSDCLRSYVRKTRDLRSSYRSGCIEVEQGIAPVRDGGSISLSLGEYYVRVRGHDGAPYTHFLLAHKESPEQKDLFIEQLDTSDLEEISAASP
jgi:hypothetical protein